MEGRLTDANDEIPPWRDPELRGLALLALSIPVMFGARLGGLEIGAKPLRIFLGALGVMMIDIGWTNGIVRRRMQPRWTHGLRRSTTVYVGWAAFLGGVVYAAGGAVALYLVVSGRGWGSR